MQSPKDSSLDGEVPSTTCDDFFQSHRTREWHRLISVSKQHILSGIFRWPRRVVLYDDQMDGYLEYQSRPHRKNRYLDFHAKDPVSGIHVEPNVPHVLTCDWKNISWHVAVFFCLGSICWIVNGQYALMQDDSTYVVNAIGYSGFAGGMLFWVGAYLAVVEALNVNKNLYYGAALEKVVDAIDGRLKLHAFHLRRAHALHLGKSKGVHRWASVKPVDPLHWRWYGYEPSIGFWAAFLQFIGATFFAVAVICGIPGVIGASQWQLQQTFIWTMQTVGSVFFVVSSWMMMVEEQVNWYMPACGRIGWQSAFWNVLGSIGFLLSAVFGYLANWEGKGTVCCQLWGTAFNTYWGSWGFMIASACLYYEVENKTQQSLAETMSVIKSWFMFQVLGTSGSDTKSGEKDQSLTV